jgi:hypothetical protein
MEKNSVSVLGVSEVRWKGQSKIKSGDYTVYYSRGERAERGTAVVVHKNHSEMCWFRRSCIVTGSFILK